MNARTRVCVTNLAVGTLLLLAVLALGLSPLFPVMGPKHHIPQQGNMVTPAVTPSPSLANFCSVNFKVDITQGTSLMPITDITQGYILQSQPVVDTTSDVVFTIVPGSAAYTALATWVAYRVANPTIPAPLFVMGDYEPTGTSSFVSSGGMGETLNINGSVELISGISSGVFLNRGVYSIGSGPSLVGTFIGGPYTITSRAGLVFSITANLDNTHDVILNIPQASSSCYNGHSVKLIILPDAQVSGVDAATLWSNIAAATSPITACAVPTFYMGIDNKMAISSATAGASLRYTLDGSIPSDTVGTPFTTPFLFPYGPVRLTAVAYKTGYTNSPVIALDWFNYAPIICPPTASVAAGPYTSAQTVALTTLSGLPTSSTPVYIRYTTDGTQPSATAGTLYSAPITISTNSTLRAVAYATGIATSPVASFAYTFSSGQNATPAFSILAGTYGGAQAVAVTNHVNPIRWTVDGSTPSSTVGTLLTFGATIPIAASCTLKAIQTGGGLTDSAVASAAYTITLPTCSPPTASPPEGGYTSNQYVTLSTATPGAVIFYTLDGSTPSATNGTRFTTNILITTSCTLTAIATKPGFADSTSAAFLYTMTIAGVCAMPVLSPGTGVYATPPTVTMTCATLLSTIRYTLDGSLPTATTGLIYTAPVTLPAGTVVLNAIAYAAGVTDSAMATATYAADAQLPPVMITPLPFNFGDRISYFLLNWMMGGGAQIATSPIPGVKVNLGTTHPSWADILLPNGYYEVSYYVCPLGHYPAWFLATTSDGFSLAYTTDTTAGTPSPTNGTQLSYVDTYVAGDYPVKGNNLLLDTIHAVGFHVSGHYGATPLAQCCAPVTCVIDDGGSGFVPPGAGPGTYPYPLTATLSCLTPGVTIRYTLGTQEVPTATTGTVYTGPITITGTATLIAVAFLTDYTPGSVSSGTYVVTTTTCQSPTITQTGSAADGSSQTYQLTCDTPGASIMYTIDGTLPQCPDQGTNGTPYTAPFTVTPVTGQPSRNIRAIAYAPGLTDSAPSFLAVLFQCAPVMFTPTDTWPGHGTEALSAPVPLIALACATPGATIYYDVNVNSAIPLTTASPVYADPFDVTPYWHPGQMVAQVRAYATADGYADAPTTQIVYEPDGTPTGVCATPVIIPSPLIAQGAHATQFETFALTCATAGATIVYTTDGTTPLAPGQAGYPNGTDYSAPFAIANDSGPHTINAIAYLSGELVSGIATFGFTYAAGGVVIPPTPNGGTSGNLLTSCLGHDGTRHVVWYNGSSVLYCHGDATGALGAATVAFADATITGLSILSLGHGALVIHYTETTGTRVLSKYSSDRGSTWQ